MSGNIPVLPANKLVPLPASANNILDPFVPSCGIKCELLVNLYFPSTIDTVQP